jgi:hypothetical protein
MRRFALALLLLLTACGDSEPEPAPKPVIAGVKVFTGLSAAHLKPGQYPQSYPQSPPVGGAHSPVWLACGVYEQAVPKEAAVHSMEHGAIWITYQPELGAPGKALVKQLAGLNPEYVLVSPYSGQDSAVVASAWGLQLTAPLAADSRLVAFIKQYAGGNQGGEQGVGCLRGGVTPEQALAAQR